MRPFFLVTVWCGRMYADLKYGWCSGDSCTDTAGKVYVKKVKISNGHAFFPASIHCELQFPGLFSPQKGWANDCAMMHWYCDPYGTFRPCTTVLSVEMKHTCSAGVFCAAYRAYQRLFFFTVWQCYKALHCGTKGLQFCQVRGKIRIHNCWRKLASELQTTGSRKPASPITPESCFFVWSVTLRTHSIWRYFVPQELRINEVLM